MKSVLNVLNIFHLDGACSRISSLVLTWYLLKKTLYLFILLFLFLQLLFKYLVMMA